jgi:hypothetical protein
MDRYNINFTSFALFYSWGDARLSPLVLRLTGLLTALGVGGKSGMYTKIKFRSGKEIQLCLQVLVCNLANNRMFLANNPPLG